MFYRIKIFYRNRSCHHFQPITILFQPITILKFHRRVNWGSKHFYGIRSRGAGWVDVSFAARNHVQVIRFLKLLHGAFRGQVLHLSKGGLWRHKKVCLKSWLEYFPTFQRQMIHPPRDLNSLLLDSAEDIWIKRFRQHLHKIERFDLEAMLGTHFCLLTYVLAFSKTYY